MNDNGMGSPFHRSRLRSATHQTTNRLSRRDWLARSGGGLGGIALAAMMADQARADGTPHAASVFRHDASGSA